MPSLRRIFPDHELIAPLDLGPPLEPIGKLIARAEFEADLQWDRDHGTRPFWTPFRLWAPGQVDDWHWLRRWVDDHLFELPPVGTMPPGQWVPFMVGYEGTR